jgi:hypothetical protein
MSIFTDRHVTIEGIEYTYSSAMHNKINKLAAIFYSMSGNANKIGFDFSESPHPTERFLYLMSLRSYIETKRIKPSKYE